MVAADARWPFPFTEEEVVAAYRQVMPEAQARELVAAMRKPLPADVLRNIEGYHLTEGTLDLLTTVSDDVARRVRQYREQRRRRANLAGSLRDEWWRKQGLEPPEYAFTEGELLAAFGKVMSAHAAREMVATILIEDPRWPGASAGHHVSDIALNLLASVSEDLARRVQQYRVALQRGIESSRQHPES